MAHLLFDALNGVTLDNQTALSVQSLLESQGLSNEVTSDSRLETGTQTTITLDEEDVFQCGKCKKQFTSFSSFMCHKKEHTAGSPMKLSKGSELSLCLEGGSGVPNGYQHLHVHTLDGVTPTELSEPIILSEADILSFNIDQNTLNIGSASQVLMPNVQYTEANIEYINCGGSGQDGIVEYSSIAEVLSREQAVTISLLDVVQPDESKAVTLNLSKSTGTNGDAECISIAPDGVSISLAEANVIDTQHSLSTANCEMSSDAVIPIFDTEDETEPPKPLSKPLKLKCQYCTKQFAKNFDLKQHMRCHTGEKPFQCVVCGRAFSQKSNVKKHMTTHKVWPNGLSRTLPKEPLQVLAMENENVVTTKPVTNNNTNKLPKGKSSSEEKSHSIVVIDRSYVCQFCNAVFPSYFELKTHMKQHSEQKVYKCIQKNCYQTFSDLDSFLEHTTMHTNEVQYCCHVCSKQFSSLPDLGLHQYSHNSSDKTATKLHTRVFPCLKCKSRFTSRKALELHMSMSSHNFPCSHCGKVFSCERYLRRHLITHGSQESFACWQCGKGFRTEQYLNTHRLTHSDERPYGCQHCSAAFNRKDKLARHSLIHQTVKKFKCPFHNYLGCTKEFNRKDKLKLHIITHSPGKPYQCKKCNRTFHRLALLRDHERTQHAVGCNFVCRHCGTYFRKKFQFTNHSCSASETQSSAEQTTRKDSQTASGRRFVRQQPRGRNHWKVRSHRRAATGDDKTKTATQSEGDNVPTIEIIVMPVSVDQQEETEQGVYRVMYPGKMEAEEPSITLAESGQSETVASNTNEASKQEVLAVGALCG